ncbi:MAG: hypothetical protein FWD88_00125 [Treponema sp.]|nr:hypothetical protein [Treponema sp.]
MRGSFLASVFVFVLAVPVFCVPQGRAHGGTLEGLVGLERAALLRAASDPAARDGLLSEVQLRRPSLSLMPRHDALERFVTEAKNDLGPAILVETLYLYSKPYGRAAEWTAAERAGLFNSITALSTLAGIQYFSITRGAMHTFYESSHVIDNPRNRAALPDPVFATPPARLVLYARQRDLTFGDNTYRFEYRAGADHIFFMQENLTSMSAGIIPAIGRNRFRMVMAIIDAGDSLLIYSAAMTRTTAVPGMGERIGNSFNNRLQAVLQWFSEHADRVFQK